MEIFVNELSVSRKVFANYKNIINLKEVYNKLVQNEVTACRISSEDYSNILSWLQEDPEKRNLLYFFISFFHAPYESCSNIDDSQEEYYSHDWSCNGTNCFGLAMSYLLDSISLSFDSNTWKEIVRINKDTDIIEVRNISEGSHVDFYKHWFGEQKNVELVLTTVSPNEKRIKLRDDHGQDILKEFSKRLIKSPYVIEIINSLPFNNKEKRFIHQIKENGIIECVLCWTDAGYGLVIRTTGRNKKETEKIAEILKEEYSK